MESDKSKSLMAEIRSGSIPPKIINAYYEEHEQLLKLSIAYFYLQIKFKSMEDNTPEEISKINHLLEFKKIYLSASVDRVKPIVAEGNSKLDLYKKIFVKEYSDFLLSVQNDENFLQNLYNKMNLQEKDVKEDNERLASKCYAFIAQLGFLFDYLEKFEQNVIYTDDVIDERIKEKYETLNKRDLTKITNRKYLDKTIFEQSLKVKSQKFLLTLEVVKKDLKQILDTDEFGSSKDDIMEEFTQYYNEIVGELNLKGDIYLKIEKLKKFFALLKYNEMNWLREENQQIYYVYIYDILIFKYRLYAVFKTYNFFKKKESEINDLIDQNKLHTIEDIKQYVFLYKHIKTDGDINGLLIKMFEGDSQFLIKTILNVKTRTNYPLEAIKTFPQITELLNKSKSIDIYSLMYKNII